MPKVRIAILEDDSTLASAMKAAFERSGFEAYVSARLDEVMEYLAQNPVNTLFVDCLLPAGSGADFAEQIRKTYPESVLDIVMMSGLFTDSSFIKETMRSTQASTFLKKPFDLKDAVAAVKLKESIVAAEAEQSPRKALYLLFNKPKVSVREKRKTIEALEEIHGFDLPYLYSLMVETQATGHLNIVGSKGDVSGISFSQGKIVSVDIVDQETQLGKLLIEAGFILPDDLKAALSAQSEKRLGERLIQGNLLSPHAFNIALANQMNIRLSRTIVDAMVEVNFVATDVELTYPHVDSDALSSFLHDWIAAKIQPAWLKAHYIQWGDYTLVKSPKFSPDHPLMKMPLISHFQGFVDHFTKGLSLNQVMDTRKYPEENAYRALHLLLAKGLLIFGEKAVIQDVNERLKNLKKIAAQFQGKNKLEIWDLMIRMSASSESSPQLIHGEFMRLIGAQPPKESVELVKVYEQLKKMAQESLEFSQTGNREQMKQKLEQESFAGRMRAASIYEEAKQALQRSQFARAATLLVKASSADPNMERLKLHQIWAKLGQIDSQGLKAQVLKEVEMELMQVPPEEKYDALYSFVMGLYNKHKGDLVTAKKFFEKSFNLDSNMVVARRELNSLANAKAQDKGVLNRDLKDLVSGFFKKR